MNINVQMNPGFKEVDRSRKRYIVMKGSAGSGKSVDTAQNYILRLMQDPGIVRNRRKIEAAVTNARLFIEIQREFGSFCRYLKSFLPDNRPVVNHWKTMREIPASTALSDAISRDMKKRGFKFFGTTICYAHLQAVGYVNDHLADCHCRKPRF